MRESQNFMKKHQVLPNISFKDGKIHKVKLIQDQIKTITSPDGQAIEGVAYKVIEDGIPKRFFTSSTSLIAKLSEYPEETTVTIQMKQRKTEQGFRSFYEVKEVKEGPVMTDISDDEIPIINEENYEGQQGIPEEELPPSNF